MHTFQLHQKKLMGLRHEPEIVDLLDDAAQPMRDKKAYNRQRAIARYVEACVQLAEFSISDKYGSNKDLFCKTYADVRNKLKIKYRITEEDIECHINSLKEPDRPSSSQEIPLTGFGSLVLLTRRQKPSSGQQEP